MLYDCCGVLFNCFTFVLMYFTTDLLFIECIVVCSPTPSLKVTSDVNWKIPMARLMLSSRAVLGKEGEILLWVWIRYGNEAAAAGSLSALLGRLVEGEIGLIEYSVRQTSKSTWLYASAIIIASNFRPDSERCSGNDRLVPADPPASAASSVGYDLSA